MLSQRAIVKRISKFCEISEETEKRGGFLAPFELIGHSFVDEFLLHPPLGALDSGRGGNQRSPPSLLSADGDGGVLLLPQL